MSSIYAAFSLPSTLSTVIQKTDTPIQFQAAHTSPQDTFRKTRPATPDLLFGEAEKRDEKKAKKGIKQLLKDSSLGTSTQGGSYKVTKKEVKRVLKKLDEKGS